MNSTIIDQHPLQLYSSLMFSIPSGSQLAQTFPTRLPRWLLHAPEPNKASDQAQYILDGQQVTSCTYFSFSSDNSLLGSCSYTGEEIHIWSLETGECVRILNNEGGADWSPFKLSHNGMWVAATSENRPGVGSANWEIESANDEEESDTRSQEESGTSSNSHRYDRLFLKIWHVDTGEFKGPLAVQYDRQPFQFSPDSKLLVLITDTGSAVVLRLDTAEFARENRLAGCEQITGPALLRRRIDPKIGEYSSLYLMEFSLDSSLLTIMSTCTDKYAVWETKTFQCIRCQSINSFFQMTFFPTSFYYRSVSIAMTSNASIMMAGAFPEEGYDNMHLEIRWVDSAEVISRLNCQEKIKYTQFSLDHTILVSIGESRSVRTWRVETGECLTLFESALKLRHISLSPDFTLLTSAEITRTISVWANGARATDQSSRKRSDPIDSVVLSSDRTLAASSSYHGVVRVWDMDTYGCTHEFDNGYQKRTFGNLASLHLFQFTKDGKYLFVSRTTMLGHM